MKLVLQEQGARELRAWLGARPDHCSSVLGTIELRRAVRRSTERTGLEDVGAAVSRQVEDVLAGVAVLTFDDTIAARAARLDPPSLRTLDSIHLATALSVDPLDGFVTYDDRLSQAANVAGLSVFAPGG
ncbi:MAG: type II toxin-antitoxin system VapC family toxin [Chloroflexota bacterium]|nr:type II toxin-antitoxin system VapC family toxin [Chloroflexota bacterium]